MSLDSTEATFHPIRIVRGERDYPTTIRRIQGGGEQKCAVAEWVADEFERLQAENAELKLVKDACAERIFEQAREIGNLQRQNGKR